MLRENIDLDWRFTPGDPPLVAAMASQDEGRVVDLPHDFTIESNPHPSARAGQATGYYEGGVGTYTKMLFIPAEWHEQRLLVEFDGAYMEAMVICNGHLVRRHYHGYTPFHADLTPYIHPGEENRLTVVVHNDAQPNSRWYTGSGIYRHVDLLRAPMVHLSPWSIFARTTHIIGGTAVLAVDVSVENHTARDRDLWVQVRVAREVDGTIVGEARTKLRAPASSAAVARTQVQVASFLPWDLDHPNLYVITAELEDSDGVLDVDSTLFGIRTLSVDAQHGLVLNGRPIKLQGGCVHHDHGVLGAAALRDAEFRKVKLHKEYGFNALRSAHNPPSRDFLEACDRLGMLVIDEAFDVWAMPKSRHDYSRYFLDHWREDLSSFVLRDRNHPSVIMWSIGNEIPEFAGLSGGFVRVSELAHQVRLLDPTRPVTSALCSLWFGLEDREQAKFFQEIAKQADTGLSANLDSEYGRSIWLDRTEAFAAHLDVVGYNYLQHQYAPSTERYPQRVICGTESRPIDALRYWEAVESTPQVIGDFVWTSQDYLGEAGIGKVEYLEALPEVSSIHQSLYFSPYPWRLANCGDIDICGEPRPQMAYRRIVWGSQETYIACRHPEHFGKHELISPWGFPHYERSWTWPGHEGAPIEVDVFSNAEEVELLLDGKVMGRAPAGRSHECRARFKLEYQPGTLEARSRVKGEIVSTDQLVTTGAPVGFRLEPSARQLVADGQSLLYVRVEIVDDRGRLVPYAHLPVLAQVEGAATLAGFGSANPVTAENYTSGKFTSYQGRLLAVVRAGKVPGTAVLHLEAEKLRPAQLKIEVSDKS